MSHGIVPGDGGGAGEWVGFNGLDEKGSARAAMVCSRSRRPMNEPLQSAVSALLAEARGGDPAPVRQLVDLVYEQLLQIARTQRRLRPGAATLNTTALVHEAFLKLVGSERPPFQDRAHFMAVAAMAMRQILIDYARRSTALKRGGAMSAVPFDVIESALDSAGGFSVDKAHALMALDGALERLRTRSERQCRLVECRFFAGLSMAETAEVLGISLATAKRDWALAQAWLYRELRDEAG